MKSRILLPLLAVALTGYSPLCAEPAALDLTKLPLPPGTKKVYVDSLTAIHATDAPVAATAEACEKLLLDQGWQSYGSAGDTRYYKRGTTRLLVTVQSEGAPGKRTMISFASENMAADLPAPPEVQELQFAGKQLGFLTGMTPMEVADFYRKALAPLGWSTKMAKPEKTDFKDVIIFRSPEKGMIQIEMTPTEGKVRAALIYSTAEEVAAEERRVAAGMAKLREKLAKDAAAPKAKAVLSLPADTGGKALTKDNLKFNVPAGKAKAAVESLRKQLIGAGWKEQSANLDAVAGNVILTQPDRSLNIIYMDPGFMPAEVTVTPAGVEIELAGK